MKKFLLLTMIVLLFPSISLATEKEQKYSESNVKVIVNGNQIFFDQDPVIVHDRIMVPIRTIFESLGGTVEWEPPGHIILNKGEIILSLYNNQKVVSRQDRRFFFLEQPPIIVNGRTMVSIRFISETIKSSVKWDENNRTVTILSDGNFIGGHEQPEEHGKDDYYYKLYIPSVGPASGPSPEEAKLYVLRQGLLNDVEEIIHTPIRFREFGGYDTMVSGSDVLGQEKNIWLTKNQYTEEISVTGSALTKESLSQETVETIIEKKGINKANIKEIYASPCSKDQVAWYVIAEQGNKKYYYCLDFYTGDVVEEYTILLQGN